MAKAQIAHPTADRIPEPVRNSPILRKVIYRRVHEWNQNFMGVFVGETGKGKSYGALRTAEALDPTFDASNVAFTLEEFFELVEEDQHEGSVIVLDEAGVGASHRDWYADAHQHLNYVLQTWRHQNRIAILTLPELDKLDPVARSRLHGYFEMIRINHDEEWSRAQFKRIKTNPRTGENYYRYPRLRWDGTKRKFKGLTFGLPSDELIEDYEERKESFTATLNKGAKDAVTPEDEEDEYTPQEAVDEIESRDAVDAYLEDSPGGQYINRNLLKVDYGLTENESKTVKSLMKRRFDLDVM
ncbi:zonular occludens toxin (zot) [Halogeometricum borinquense]|uniref:Zonular occludens toxin (Zot) n=1 Tax=Halogeometricum borinquense TaxID=60847 RepID=A0A6C0UJM8_9EURY|nr:zonular occludens toxin (zot) [Halogeometricum borinquense]QIB75726.1 zonular occludens toxin (zot) [Halogeometricum borinquense]QIQ77614.1 zonular occludens toxin (zot) [Halogeometricum borinquense]